MKDFRDKVAAITGAGSGIGRGLALTLAERGCHLALCDVNQAGLAETAALASEHGVRVTQAIVDVADREAVHAWADASAAEHGKINLVFNNAGVSLIASITAVSYEDLEWIMDINFWGVVHGSKAFLPHLIASGEGHIVNVSSVFGLFGVASQGGYNASKFAVRGFTDCLRQELDIMRCGVSATCVHPGGIKTNIARDARSCDSIQSLGYRYEKDDGRFKKYALTTPARAARLILRAVEKNKRRARIGADAVLLDLLVRWFPAHYHPMMQVLMRLSMHKLPAPIPEKAEAPADSP